MKILNKLEHEIITEAEVGNENYFRELHSFALTEKGRKVLTPGTNYVKTGNHVGVIQTRSGFILEILPKIHEVDSDVESTRRMFVKMLKTLRNVPKYRDLNLAHLRVETMPILEIFISMYLDEVQAIIKRGVKSNYISMEENCCYLKGKLVAGEHIRRNIVHKERFYLNYDEYIEDIPQNRVLKAALLYCGKISGCESNRRRIREHLYIFDRVSIPIRPSTEFDKIIYDRTSDYYARALEWAMIFLGGKSFTTYSGNSIAYALLFPMELVFESFVYTCINEHTHLSDVTYQSMRYYLAKEGSDPIFMIKPDIVALSSDRKKRYILDAKWKIIDQENRSDKYGISQSDMYQLLSYAEIYRSNEDMDVELFIVYPKTEMLVDAKTFTYNTRFATKLTVIPFDIKAILENDATCLNCIN